MVLPLVAGALIIGTAIVASQVLPSMAKDVASLRFSPETRQAFTRPETKRAIATGYQRAYDIRSQRKLLTAQGALGVVQEITPLGVVSKTTREEIYKNVRKDLMKRGYSLSRATTIAQEVTATEIAGGGIGEAGAGLFAGVGGEVVGRVAQTAAAKAATRYFPKILSKRPGLTMAIVGGGGSATGGLVEGAAQESSRQISRREKYDPGRIAFAGLAGATYAGTAGTLTAGTRLRSPRVSHGIDIIASAPDISEKPAELLIGKTFLRRYVPEPKLPVRRPRVPSAGGRPKTPAQGGRPKTPAQTPAQTPTQVATPAQTPPSPTQAPTPSKTPTPTQVPTPSKTPTPTQVPATPTPSEEPTPSEAQAPTQTATPTGTQTQITIPTVTPIIRGAPPPVPAIPYLGETSRRPQYGRLRFYDEVAAARRLARRLM